MYVNVGHLFCSKLAKREKIQAHPQFSNDNPTLSSLCLHRLYGVAYLITLGLILLCCLVICLVIINLLLIRPITWIWSYFLEFLFRTHKIGPDL
jgi:uncharacterized membrane protein SpoIIM required for sporulation